MKKTLIWLSLVCLAVAPVFAQENKLTPEEVEQGWLLLWDGETEFGWEWHGAADWTFYNGVIAARSGAYGWLGTTTTFGDFHLKLEFRTAADGNSGVFLRSAREGEPHRTGYELQIYDDQPQGFNTGSLVFYEKAPPAKLRPDVWNTYDIIAEGPNYQIVLNGKLVFEGSNPTHLSGVIGLQFNPDKPIEFRNIKLRPLGLNPLFDGSTLNGWTRTGAGTWSADDGFIHSGSGSSQLESEQQFRNVVLQFRHRETSRARSAIGIRGAAGQAGDGYLINRDGDIIGRSEARGEPVPEDTWSRKTVVAYDKHISVWADGVQVLNYEDTSPEGANSRRQLNTRMGVIGLQGANRENEADFDDIQAAEIQARPSRLQ